MATLNRTRPTTTLTTHEGGTARHQSTERELSRAVLACLLWEDSFYENGVSIAQRIGDLVAKAEPSFVANLAVTARNTYALRHVPLLLVREMARHDAHKPYVRETLRQVIRRADELAEFLAIYWADKKQPLAAQVKKGLADAFTTFSEYDLAKYNRDKAIKLRDVLFLTHAKPRDGREGFTKVERKAGFMRDLREQELVFKKLVDNALATPDTWETAISAAKGNPAQVKAEWSRLLDEGKLGGLALLRNLRNMVQADVDLALIRHAIRVNAFKFVLPFRFIAAANAVPASSGLHDALEQAMLRACATLPKLTGTTTILVDISGSMAAPLSAKSDLRRVDAAAALAVLVREVSEQARVITYDVKTYDIPSHLRGFALKDAITQRLDNATHTGAAVTYANSFKADRLIVITDEQSHDRVGDPVGRGYMVNISSERPSIAYGPWMSLTGFSENLVRFIAESESTETVVKSTVPEGYMSDGPWEQA